MGMRIRDFFEYPTVTDLKIVQAKELEFPAAHMYVHVTTMNSGMSIFFFVNSDIVKCK